MLEEFLQYIWKYGLFDRHNLVSDTGEPVEIIKLGEQNMNAGPDFTDVRLRIGKTLWAGNVEVHIHASDWYKHQHHKDEAYSSVVLQVVHKSDQTVKRKNGEVLPSVELKFDDHIYRNYKELIGNKMWIACQDKLAGLDKFVINYWMDTLMIERLIEKSSSIRQTLEQNHNDWTETFYIHLARNFGFKVNADPFEMLARSVPVKYLARHKNNLSQLEAVLFGQAGFLNDNAEDEYINTLRKEYKFLQSKFNLKPLDKHIFKFLRLRPDNFPTIRIAQFASLIYKSSFLFSKIIDTESVSKLTGCFDIAASDYWSEHYQFGKEFAGRKNKKKLGNESFNNIIINTVAPFLFLYGLVNGREDVKDRALNFLHDVPAEKNAIIRGWAETGIKPVNAFQSQALIQLKNNYCNRHKCLQCQLGNKIITTIN